jgi:hypothetical protein
MFVESFPSSDPKVQMSNTFIEDVKKVVALKGKLILLDLSSSTYDQRVNGENPHQWG